jgi:hypothetical protein
MPRPAIPADRMKPRHVRLEAILELLAAGPDGKVRRDDIYRAELSKNGVAPRTARDDLQALELTKEITWEWGWAKITPKGRAQLARLKKAKLGGD